MSSVIIVIVALFFVGLVLQTFFQRLCAICFAVSLTWLYGLLTGWDPLILAMLMGGSAVGLMYYLGTKFPSGFGFFKLPYLVTAFVVIESFLSRSLEMKTFLILIGVWIVFLIVYIFRKGIGASWFKKVVECCKNW